MKNNQFRLAPIVITALLMSVNTSLIAQPEFSKLSAKERIAIAEKEEVQAATDAGFQNDMQTGHDLFKEKHYLKAIRAYELAQERRPYNVYPKVKISDIELSMKDTLAILRAEEKRELAEKPKQKEPAKQVKPEPIQETEEERLKKLDNWEKNEREKRSRERERSEKEPDNIPQSSGDVPKISMEDFQKELAEKYPSGTTEETSVEGNKTIVKRVIVREGKGNEYKKVTHNWGGVFYFKNGDAVTERVWKAETEK